MDRSEYERMLLELAAKELLVLLSKLAPRDDWGIEYEVQIADLAGSGLFDIEDIAARLQMTLSDVIGLVEQYQQFTSGVARLMRHFHPGSDE